jgi:hypothetical protein
LIEMDINTRFTQIHALENVAHECSCPEPCDCDHDND